jgi:hypothetical protein
MHELEPLADERERLIEPPLERPLQLLIHGRSHSVDLLPQLEALPGEIVAQTPLQPLARTLGGFEAEEKRMKVDTRLSSGEDEE